MIDCGDWWLGPEEYQARYDEYKKGYLFDYSEAFFDEHCVEGWFRDRYDPAKVKEGVLERMKNAQEASTTFANELLQDPTTFLKGVCLDAEWVKREEEEEEEEEKDSEEEEDFKKFEKEASDRRKRRREEGSDDGESDSDSSSDDDEDEDDEEEEDNDDGEKEENGERRRRVRDKEGREQEAGYEAQPQPTLVSSDPRIDTSATIKATKHIHSPLTFPGHLDRTVFVRGIPPSCPSSLLLSTILKLTKHSPERVSISKPERMMRKGMERFMWIVFSSPHQAKEALQAMNRSVVEIPEYDPEKVSEDLNLSSSSSSSSRNNGETSNGGDEVDEDEEMWGSAQPWNRLRPSHSFHLMALPHVPRSVYFPTPRIEEEMKHHLNSFTRLKIDCQKAKRLCEVFDRAMGVPSSSSFSSLLSSSSIVDGIRDITENEWHKNEAWIRRNEEGRETILHLDLAICYLRRVHFVSYYSGKGLESEGDMMGVCPSVVCRPFLIEGQDYTKLDKVEKQEEMKEEGYDEEEPKEEKGGDEKKNDTNEERKEEEEDYLDQLLDKILVKGGQLERWRVMLEGGEVEKKEGGEEEDEEYFKRVLQLCEGVELERDLKKKRWMEKNSQGEEDGKARCCVRDCGKLFKNTEFLHSHLAKKHADLLDVSWLFLLKSILNDSFVWFWIVGAAPSCGEGDEKFVQISADDRQAFPLREGGERWGCEEDPLQHLL